MKITGQAVLDAAPAALWPLVFDPGTLLQLLPGCEDVVQAGPDAYRATMTLRIPAVAGTYAAQVQIVEHAAPHFCRLQGEASGRAGAVRGTASFTLAAEGGQTRLSYDADAQISGPLASLNPRFIEGVAQGFIRQGLGALPALARQRTAAEAARLPRRGGALRLIARALWAAWRGLVGRMRGRRA